ncbi:MAG: tryptophan synthase subunit alpha [Rickettsiales bacterium]|jgi:tryptophan synthase alpha chain|nr:tryptophan synthase subunit alpha [Rickettsiales bacterium]
MTTRINNVFSELKSQNRAALIPFIMGFDPDEKASRELLKALPDAGADIIEIGLPFSDPMADGPTIQAAGLRALNAGATARKILSMVEDLRKQNQTTPVILMGYFNPIYCYGCEAFCKDAAKAGVDGLIIVDLPPEEEAELTSSIVSNKLSLIRLVAPTSLDDRLEHLMHSATGFVYYISVAGITGAKSATKDSLSSAISNLRRHTKLPIAIGFGIKTAEQANEAAKLADAVVVGSALVERFHQDGHDSAIDFVRSLAAAMKR